MGVSMLLPRRRPTMRRIIVAAILLGLSLGACASQPTGGAPLPTGAPPSATAQPVAGGGKLIVMTHDSFNVSADVLEAFEQQTGVSVQILKSGDAGAALNKAIISKDNPLADVFFGVDNTFL